MGVPDSVTNKDSKSTPPMRARSKHHHKANAVSNKPAAGPTTSTATSSAASSASGSSSTKPTGVSEKSNTSTGSKGKATYCYEFFNTGSCKHGANCRFAHIQPRRSPRLQQGDKSVKSSSSDGGKSFQSANYLLPQLRSLLMTRSRVKLLAMIAMEVLMLWRLR
mmetsp:Transcript_12343/g.13425  ORF Transcript_12343/g.13425 Transcript_12343/m.13425 type:complete len:164 (+) Transcript_12343:89-580(+)